MRNKRKEHTRYICARHDVSKFLRYLWRVVSARGTFYQHKWLGARQRKVIMYVLYYQDSLIICGTYKVSVCDLRGHGARDKHRSIMCWWLSIGSSSSSSSSSSSNSSTYQVLLFVNDSSFLFIYFIYLFVFFIVTFTFQLNS